jgi:hypothetical protein
MQDDSYKKIIIDIRIEHIRDCVAKYTADNSGEKETTCKMEPDLLYLTTYFQILVSLIDNSNKVNMGKLIKRFPFKDLVDFIKECKMCWPLKRNIRAFLNRLYYLQPKV